MADSGVIDQMRRGFTSSTMLMKIIWVNIGVFVVLRLIAIVCMFGGDVDFINTVMKWVQLPSSLPTLATRPWTVLSYMFAQYDVLHILFNMLWFYWFGTLFRMVSTPRQMLALYIYGGLGGAVLFLLFYNSFPMFHHASGWLIGSSASVMAIVTATAILMPDFRMHLVLIGPVALKWIALATVGLVLLGVSGSNAGGEMAHIGGVLTGVLYALRMKRGHDITVPFNRLIDTIVNTWHRGSAPSRRPAGKSTMPPPPRPGGQGAPGGPSIDPADREELDAILDKIKKSGYASLTPEERKRLFDVSRRMK